MPDTQTSERTTDDVLAIIQGMSQAPAQDRTQALVPSPLPSSLQPDYQPQLPQALQPRQASNLPVPSSSPSPQQSPAPWASNQPNFTVGPVQPGDPGYQLPPQQRPVQIPVTPVTPPQQIPQQIPPQFAGLQTDLVRDPTGRNNPGNLRIPGARGPAGFQSFPTMQAGIQAMQNNLLAYQDRYGLNTIQGIISRWTPPNENDTERAISQAEQVMGINRNQRIDLHDPATMQLMTNAILFNEQGGNRGRGGVGGGAGYKGIVDLNSVRDQMQLPQPQQQYAPAQPRSFGEWGREPPGMGGQQPGEMPRESDFGRIMSNLAPLLVGIGSLALRLPLSTAITAYGAMARAQQNGQELDYQRNRQIHKDQIEEATRQQTQESRDAGDAFIEYGNNNPQGLQQRLAEIALQYNDPTMYRMAERGDLNGIHQLQQRRDMYNQNLVKYSKAQQEEEDRQAENAAVAAMDRKWRQENPNATEDEAAIAHNEHIGEAGRAGTRSSGSAKPEQEGEVRDVLDKDGNRVRQVREGKTGGLFDLSGNPTTIDEKGGETLAQPSRGAGGRDPTEGDYTWTNPDGSRGEGYAKIKGKQLVDAVTEEPIPTKPGTRVNKISQQSASQAGNAAHGATGPIQDWDGMNEGKAPPGVTEADWAQAQDWARLGRAPPGLSSRSGAYQGAHDALPYALHALGKTGADMPRDAIDYETQRAGATATERYFASGMGARQLTALDTVAAHIGLFREYAAAVKSGNITAINEVAGRLATATGSPELIDMGIAATITGDEVIRLLTQTGGSRGDREDIKDKLSVYSSPEQFEGIANTLTNFVRERYDPLRQQYTNRIGATEADKARYEEAFKNKITPAARAIIERKEPIAGGSQVQPMTEEQYNAAPSGTRYRMPTDPPEMIRVKP